MWGKGWKHQHKAQHDEGEVKSTVRHGCYTEIKRGDRMIGRKSDVLSLIIKRKMNYLSSLGFYGSNSLRILFCFFVFFPMSFLAFHFLFSFALLFAFCCALLLLLLFCFFFLLRVASCCCCRLQMTHTLNAYITFLCTHTPLLWRIQNCFQSQIAKDLWLDWLPDSLALHFCPRFMKYSLEKLRYNWSDLIAKIWQSWREILIKFCCVFHVFYLLWGPWLRWWFVRRLESCKKGKEGI